MTNAIRIAICEDLESDQNKLVSMIHTYLDRNDLFAEIDTFLSGESFLQSDVTMYALVFFDIYMGEINGMETAKRLIAKNNSVNIVFCSGTRDFAAESYDVSAMHYIIKPVEEEKLCSVLDRFFDGKRELRTITVKVGRTEETVFIKDILYAEAANKKTLLHTKNGVLGVSMPFSYFCDALKEPDFVRPIRYALVAVSRISKVPSKTVILSDGTEFPVSRSARQHVRDVFSDYKWKTAMAENMFSGNGGLK